MSETRHAQLSALLREYDDTRSRLHQLVDALDEEAWSQPPPSGGWSVAQCVAHLNLSAAQFLPRLQEAVATGQREPRARPPSRYRLDMIGWLLVKALEPPPRFKTRTPAAFDPSQAPPRADAVAAFDGFHDEIARLVHDAREVDLGRLKVVSPFDPRGKLRYSVYSALRVIVVHERRHLWQAARAVERSRAAGRPRPV